MTPTLLAAGGEIPSILKDIVLILLVATASSLLLRRLKAPTIIGFLFAGALVGPGGFGLGDVDNIQTLAESGVILLLFIVGLKLSLRDLFDMKVIVFGVGGIQVGLTMAATIAFCLLIRLPLNQSIFWGILVSLSSTALVLSLYETSGELETQHGRVALGTLLFQDLMVIPFMLCLPLLASGEGASVGESLFVLGKSVALLTGVVVAAYYLFPWFIARVAETRSREIFSLSVLLVVFGTSLILGLFNLSMALGAFIAGIVISESEYSRQIQSETLTLRDALTSLFFVSIGMLVDPGMYFESPLTTLGLLFGVIVLKFGAMFLATLFIRGARVGILAGAGMAQVGEFSFVIAYFGYGSLKLVGEADYKMFLAVSIPSMLLTPVLIALARNAVFQWGWLSRAQAPTPPIGSASDPDATLPVTPEGDEAVEQSQMACAELRDHVIIIGYGPNGQAVSRALTGLGIPFVALELNPMTVRRMREQGVNILYGDACRPAILMAAGLSRARAVVITGADPMSARQIVANARGGGDGVATIARTRFARESKRLIELGADHVIVEEFESALELVATIMSAYGASVREIEREREAIRGESFAALTEGKPRARGAGALSEMLMRYDTRDLTLAAADWATGKRLDVLELRAKTGVSIIALERGGKPRVNPGGEVELQAGDIVFLFGMESDLRRAESWLRKGQEPQDDTSLSVTVASGGA